MTATELPDGTITVLLTDIEGSTQRWDADGDSMAEAVRRHEEILATAIGAHDGRRPLEQGEGDSVVAGFSRASDAVAAACEAQAALDAENWPGRLSLRVRMALHTGEVRVVDGERYAGPVLIRAARLRGLAHGGQVLLSSVTRDLVVDELPDGSSLIDHGWHALRGLNRPEHVTELRRPGSDDAFPPLMSIRASNLPVEVTTFVGRGQEVADLVDALATTRVLTLTGTGGCGKTRLAQRLAALVEAEFEGGVWWVDAAPLGRGELLAASAASSLGLADDPYRGPVDRIIDQLGDAPALIIVDNCEHLLDDASRLVASLTQSCRGLRVVVTSREALDIPGEMAWRVPSLPDADAVALFAERARVVRPNLELGEATAPDVARICRRLDGIPLAIELAAARARVLSVSQIADALDDRFRLLTGGQRTVVQRQRTLSASIDWSHDLLDDDERAVFRRLSVFAGDFGLDAAEEVAAGGSVDRYTVLDIVGRLVDKSLLMVDDRGDPARYRMLESIRQYARDRLVDAEEVDETQSRHLGWFSPWVIGLGPELTAADHARRLDELEGEIENLRVALGWAEAVRDGDRLRAMCVALTFFWMLHGHFREGAAWCDRALELDGDSDRARTQWGLAYIALYAGEYDKALELALAGHASAEADGDVATMARCLDTLATMQVFVDVPATIATATDAIALAREADDRWCLADSLQVLATALLVFDELEEAEPYFAEAFEIATSLDNRQLLAWHWALSAGARLRDARPEEAEALARRGLTIAEEVGDLGIIGHGAFVLGRALAMRGRFDEARAVLDRTIRRLDEREAPMYRTLLTTTMALILFADDDVAGSLEVLADGSRDAADTDAMEDTYRLASRSVRLAANPETAAGVLAELVADPLDSSIHESVLELAFLEARARLFTGDVVGAERVIHEHFGRMVELGLWSSLLPAVDLLAVAAAFDGSDLEAVRLFDAAAAIRLDAGMVRASQRPLDLDAIEHEVRDRLRATAWEGESHVLDREELVEYVRRARGERKRPTFGWRSLTPTEERVVDLVAEGLTNPQIAEKLFISRSTVKTHLAHVFSKLEVSTRSELAAAAARRER